MAEVAINTYIHFKTTTCITCGCIIALVDEFYDHRMKDRKSYYCPSGHAQFFSGETEEAKLKKQLERAVKEKEWAEQSAKRAREDARHEERRRIATQGVLTRTKNRIKNGVCPCCKRSFPNLHAHMKTKHPGYETNKGESK